MFDVLLVLVLIRILGFSITGFMVLLVACCGCIVYVLGSMVNLAEIKVRIRA